MRNNYLECSLDNSLVQVRASRSRVRETARRLSAGQTIKIRQRAVVVCDEFERLHTINRVKVHAYVSLHVREI